MDRNAACQRKLSREHQSRWTCSGDHHCMLFSRGQALGGLLNWRRISFESQSKLKFAPQQVQTQ